MNYPNKGASKPIQPDCAEIYRAVFRHFSQNYYRIANTYIYRWESDFFCKTKAGYSIEVEVKVSRSDFFADFKKTHKHELLQKHKQRQVYNGYNYTEIGKAIPNRFFYAMPEGLVTVDEIPAYAGALFYQKSNHGCYGVSHVLKCVKDAPLLHKNKQNQTAILLEKFYRQSINTRNQVHELQQRLKEKDEFIKKHLKGYLLPI